MGNISFLASELNNLIPSLAIANEVAKESVNTSGLVFYDMRNIADVCLDNPIGDGIYIEDFRGKPYNTPIAIYIEVYNDPYNYMVFIPAEFAE